ncbi:MAG: acetate uptake transporter [Thermoplasmatales archaeon]|nr:MAG: acetate uptake transporter [Thermoplasmatales archaeon]
MVEKNILANPAPLGLMGFGMTTVLLNIHNAGLFAIGSMILAMGIFYGGLAQIIAGILEYKKGNTFGVTAFTSYGLFWLSLVGLLIIPKVISSFNEPGDIAMGSYLFMWGLFTFLMFISTLKKPKALQLVFSSLMILFWLLALGHFVDPIFTTIAGYEGIICGMSAIYLAMAEVINETFGKTILPIGGPTIK